MLKSNLKKYKLMYRADLIVTTKEVGSKYYPTFKIKEKINKHKNNKKLLIIDEEEFDGMLIDGEDNQEFWDINTDQYCNLDDINERKQLVNPKYEITKAYLKSDENFYDIAKEAKIKTILRGFDDVLDDIVKSNEYFLIEEALLTKAHNYIDDIIYEYEKNNAHKSL